MSPPMALAAVRVKFRRAIGGAREMCKIEQV